MDLSDKIIIFLDIDGVLNNMKTQYAWFDKHSINVLNYVTKKYHAKIVISSSWREEYDLDELRRILFDEGVVGDIIDVTPVYTGSYSPEFYKCKETETCYHTGSFEGRNYEIWKYIHDNNVKKYVIIDDYHFCNDELVPHVVETKMSKGLTKEHIKEIESILK